MSKKARIHFTINPSISWHEICWIDEYGTKRNVTLDVGERGHDPQSDRDHFERVRVEFIRQHPGAEYMKPEKLGEYWALIAYEKEKLALWNGVKK